MNDKKCKNGKIIRRLPEKPDSSNPVDGRQNYFVSSELKREHKRDETKMKIMNWW